MKITRIKDTLDIQAIFDIESIPVEELESQYVDLSFALSMSGYGGHFVGDHGKVVNEAAIATLSVDETESEISRKLKLKKWQFAVVTEANNIKLVVLYPSIFKNKKIIKDAMAACGWSFSNQGYYRKGLMVWRAMSFDPMFQDNISNDARRLRYAYHWTPYYNYDKILKDGLLPKSENKLFDYPDRIHLIKGSASNIEKLNIGKQLYLNNRDKMNDGDYVLLTIDLSLIDPNIEIYYDPRYQWGYYTKDPIPPFAIKGEYRHNFKR